MRLIIIHGPPAAGKLTIANELDRLAGFRVFHNHLTIDCTRPVFDFGTKEFWDINARLRCEVIAEAARQDIDLVHTFCYGRGIDDKYFRDLVAAATGNGGTVHIVLVHCRDDVRKARIVDESRVKMWKLTDPASVDDNAMKPDLFSTHPDFTNETLVIDTSERSPGKSAALIIDHFGLGRLTRDGERHEI